MKTLLLLWAGASLCVLLGYVLGRGTRRDEGGSGDDGR